MDWKLERSVQAKVRDSKEKRTTNKQQKQNEKHDYRSVPKRKHFGSVYKWRLMPDFWLMGFILKTCLVHHTGFTPTMIRFLSSDSIPNEDCRVVILRCRSTFHLTCPILSHESYKYKCHTYIHTFMHINIHAYITCTQHHSYMIALTTLSLDSTTSPKGLSQVCLIRDITNQHSKW